jgi:hypothetical protein
VSTIDVGTMTGMLVPVGDGVEDGVEDGVVLEVGVIGFREHMLVLPQL